MLVELAIGDAYGAGFEYTDPATIRAGNTLERYVHHPRHKSLRPGNYTDDTQMSIAIAETIVSGLPWTPEVLADAFVRCFKRDPREGYASRFYEFLVSMHDGKEFLARIRPTSDKSGAAMRASPIGIFPTVEEVKEKATLQAAVTHNTTDGINAAIASALMTHYFLYERGRKENLGAFIESHVEGRWAEPWQGKVGEKGWMSVRAAITSVQQCDRLRDLLKTCVSFSGDVDTVAAIAMGAASCSTEYRKDIPIALTNNLENGVYGRVFLEDLNAQLLEKRNALALLK